MTIDEALADLIARVGTASPEAVIRVARLSETEAVIRAYAPAEAASAIKAATDEVTTAWLTGDGLDVQVLVYDIATTVPPDAA